MTILLLLAALTQPPPTETATMALFESLLNSVRMPFGATPVGLPPIAYLPYQTQARSYNELCMHVSVCNGLRAIEYQALGTDPGDLSVRFVGLSAVKYGGLDSPNDPFGTLWAARTGHQHGSCLAHLCLPNATVQTPTAIADALLHKGGGFVMCGSMDEVRAQFKAGPCVVFINLNAHAYMVPCLTADDGCVAVDPYPNWLTGKARVAKWSKSYAESTIKRLGVHNVCALVRFRE
jgi:hypothetical protein